MSGLAGQPPAAPALSVIIPTHDPDPGRLRLTMAALRAQTLPPEFWETVLVDNASAASPISADCAEFSPANLRVVREPVLGLTHARVTGFRSARGDLAVLVDDDNVLAPGYLAEVVRIFSERPRLGAAGGKSQPDFETPPAPWQREFFGLLALRDLGDVEQVADSLRPPGAARNEYPAFAPIGAGMALRREAALAWIEAIERDPRRRRLDRKGRRLVSGGDNDLVMTLLGRGWSVGYFPSLSLTHRIPKARLDGGYLGRLNCAIQKSWVQVLALHDANPWPLIPAWTVPLRKAKAWFTYRGWSGPAARIRWKGACGHFEGRSVHP